MAAASIFICHAQSDAAFAHDLGLALETHHLNVWRDRHHARGGDQFAPEVRWAIEQARQVIVVLSLNTGEATWLRREIEFAQEVERHQAGPYRVIPLLLPGVDDVLFAHWFTSPLRMPPLHLPPDGLGAVLPDLLRALGEQPANDPLANRDLAPVMELELSLSREGSATVDSWQLDARLIRQPGLQPAIVASSIPVSLPTAPDPRLLHWYLQTHPCWPADAVRRLARHAEAVLASWGRALYRATLDMPSLAALLANWSEIAAPAERRLVLRADVTQPVVASLLAFPWELLHGPAGFLIQDKQPVQFVRRLPGGGGPFPVASPPLRVLALSPRPDTEPTGHPDYRRGILPLLDAIKGLGGLMEARVLTPPTLTALKNCLSDAWIAGRLFTALHLDCYLRDDPHNGEILLGFEASYDPPAPICREAHFVEATALASRLVAYRIRLVVLHAGTGNAVDPASMVRLASILLAAGIAAVVIVYPDTPAETQQRFWATFYKELLRGARITQAVCASQHHLAGDGYRAPGLDGGDVHLRDWFCCKLYRGEQDPRLCQRPPLEIWRELLNQVQTEPPGPLPQSAIGFVGRGRDLLVMERLLDDHATIFLRGPGGVGKTAAAVALLGWLTSGGRYRHVAYVDSDAASNPHALLETLGRQLLPAGQYGTINRYPTLWQALDYLRETLRAQPTLIVLDQVEQWPSEHDEAFAQFWKTLLREWPALRLLGLGRLGPPPFARPWLETTLSPLDDQDAINLIGRVLIAVREMPPATDRINNFKQLWDFVTLAGGHPGALWRLAREIAFQGANATLVLLRPLRAELLRLYSHDPQWPLYLSLELTLRRLSDEERERLLALAFFRHGASRIALGTALALDTQALDAFCARLIALDLVEDRGYGHLRFDSALSFYLAGLIPPTRRSIWRERWRAGMDHLLTVLYQQYFKDKARTTHLLRLELPNLLALLRDYQQQFNPERIARLASYLEPLLAHLGVPAALTEVAAARERAGLALSGWSRARFETERLRVERLRDDGALEASLHAARHLLDQCQRAGSNAYAGASYDLGRAHFQLGKLLKLAGDAERAVKELDVARQRFQALADAGNVNASRMAAVIEAEAGDCLTYLHRLEEAATAYEAAIARAGPTASTLAVAADKMQLGLVRQRQGRHAEAVALYDAARRLFENLGEPEGAARAWQHLGLACKLNGEMEAALHACQQALYRYEQQRNHNGMTETLNELGHIHQALNQPEEAALAYRRVADLCRRLGDGHGEEASRNKLAHVLIQLHRHDEARQELYRASECNLPDSYTARNWTLRRGLDDVGQALPNPSVADQARRQAMRKYLAYRRAGGENTNPGARLCARLGQAIRAGDTTALATTLEQIAASPNVPSPGKLLVAKLQAIVAGSRDPALTTDPDLHYQYAVELQLLLEELAR